MRLPVLVCLACTAGAWPMRAPTVIHVAPGADLQAALDRARPSDTVVLAAGATYTGHFVLPAVEGGDAYITVRSSTPDRQLPDDDERMGPAYSARLARLQSPDSLPVIRTAPGAHHWRLQFLEFLANVGGGGDIIRLGDGSGAQNRLEIVPHDLVIDRCYIHGDPTMGQKRGIALNSARTSILGSYIADIKAIGQDSQAIAGWNGPGPFLIENNYLSAAGENVMFGGGDPAIRDLVPSDITIRRNHFTKALDWRWGAGTKWTVKNLFELKNARRVLVEWNVFERNWPAAQNGYAILWKSENQDGTAPWSVTEEVTFQFNLVRDVSSAINIAGYGSSHQSLQARRFRVVQNVFVGVDQARWGGDGRFLLIGSEPADIIVDHNTVLQSGAAILAYGGARPTAPIRGFEFTNNLVRHNEYGVKGDNRAAGLPTLETYFPNALFEHNVLAGGSASEYPPGNYFPSEAELMREFVAPGAGDYRLRPTSRYRTLGNGRSALGADAEAILRSANEVLAAGHFRRPRAMRGRAR